MNNASTDGTKEYLEGLIPNITVVNIATNSAFSGACNQGAGVARGEYLVFLSNDTIVTADWLVQMLQPLIRDKSIGMLGCKLVYPNETIQHAGVGYTNVHGWLEPVHVYRGYPRYAPEVMSSRETQAVTGACFMISRHVYSAIGMLDRDYINGLEDIDLCLKVKSSGLKIWYEAGAEVYHLESQTPGRFDYAMQNVTRFRDKWEQKGIIQIDTDVAEGVYRWKQSD